MYRHKKRFGQNFLVDAATVNDIVDVIDPKACDTIVEIGPGDGALTTLLISKAKFLHAIEIDNDLITKLDNKFSGFDNFKLHHQDVLQFDFNKLETANKIKIIGNLPYNISTEVLFYLLQHISMIDTMTFMLQLEVVNRITATKDNKSYGRLSVMLQCFFDTEKQFEVSADKFDPVPKVESAIVTLTPKAAQPIIKDYAIFSNVVQHAFNMRRKTIRNSLAKLITVDDLAKLKIDAKLRAENLSVDDFLLIANYIARK